MRSGRPAAASRYRRTADRPSRFDTPCPEAPLPVRRNFGRGRADDHRGSKGCPDGFFEDLIRRHRRTAAVGGLVSSRRHLSAEEEAAANEEHSSTHLPRCTGGAIRDRRKQAARLRERGSTPIRIASGEAAE